MSDRDRPSDVWGRSERTVIRPNPGARRPVTPPSPPKTPDPAAPPSVEYPSPESAASTPSPSQEDWIATQPQKPSADRPAAHAELRIDELAAPNANPILRAAGPLLLLLGGLRVALLRASFASLMEQVADAIKFFEKDIRSAGIPEGQANSAKYILCATADDIVQNIPTEDRHVWTQYSMLSRFFGERIGGVRFFEELERAKMDPLVNYPILELQHSCLALGFQGIHRTSTGGQSTLQQIQRNLYETLRRVRPRVNRHISPHWRGQQLPLIHNRVRVPVWITAAVAGVLLLGFYLLLRTLLGSSLGVTANALAQLHPNGQLTLERRVFAPPPPPPPPPPPHQLTQLERIRNALAPEIAADKLTADENATQIYIRVGDLVLFRPGQDHVLPSFEPIIPRIAAALNKEPGDIRVIGHTDNTPIHNIRFASNWELSVARAKAVGQRLMKFLSQPDRVKIEGKGAEMPIASNQTAEGRARNRRVEVRIPRAD
jgi:type VI secretion system protein ImpK